MGGGYWSETRTVVLKASSNEFQDASLFSVGAGDGRSLRYLWNQMEGSSYRYFKFRFNDDPWYVVDSSFSGVIYNTDDEEDPIFQVKASNDGVHWTERVATNDADGIYDEDNMPSQGWIVEAQASAQWPFLVAFLIPKRAVIGYYNSQRLNTAVSVDLGASYETKGGNGFGLRAQYVFTPTSNGVPFQVYSLSFDYSRLLYHTKRYNLFQLWLDLGLGPALCVYENVGSFGFASRVGLSGRLGITDSLFVSTSLDVNAALEPDFNNGDEIRIGTTLYLTLPLRIGIGYSFKEVED